MSTSIVNLTGISQENYDLVQKMIEVSGGRTILSRSECKKAAHLAGPAFNRTFAWCPAWIVKNDAARAKDADGKIVHGMFDLSIFHVVEKVAKVRVPKASKLLSEVIDATEEMAKTVESEQILTEVIAATETPEVVEVPVEAAPTEKKKSRAERRAAKKAAAEATATE